MLAAYVMLYEHIGSSQLLPITPSDLTTRVWDIINHKKAWTDIAARKNVKKLFREFNFPAPPERPMPDRPKVTVKAGPVDRGPGGAGPDEGDDDAPDWWSMRSGQISRSDLPSSYDRPLPELEDVEDGASDYRSVTSGMKGGPSSVSPTQSRRWGNSGGRHRRGPQLPEVPTPEAPAHHPCGPRARS